MITQVFVTEAFSQIGSADYPTLASVIGDALELVPQAMPPLNRANLKDLVDGDSTTGFAPSLGLTLYEVPAAGATGAMALTLTLMENDDLDGTYQSNERRITASVTVNWASDGTNIEMTVPSDTLAELSYAHNGNGYSFTGLNAIADVFTFNAVDTYSNIPASIEVRALDFFAAAIPSAIAEGAASNDSFAGLNLGSFFDGADNYHVSVGIDTPEPGHLLLGSGYRTGRRGANQ